MSQNLIHGNGETANLIRAHNWTATPLGPIGAWSPALLTTVNMILAVPTPIQIFWGPGMTMVYNDAFLPLLNHKHPSALGSSARRVWAEVWSDVGAQLEAVFTHGTSFDFHDLPLSILDHGRLRHGFFTFTYSAIREVDGSVAGLLNITQETTATVLAQRALRDSERRFRTLIQSASVGIAIGNTAGELTYLNPALLNMLGYNAQQVAEGHVRWDQLTPPRFAAADQQAIQQLLATGVAEPYEKAYLSSTGEPIPVHIGASVIPADQGLAGASDVAVFVTDLRRQKRAEGALLQTEKLAAVGKLASSISHEINNPLEAVTNLLYLVQQDPALSQTSRDFLGTADRELARMAQVTSQTLRFHRQSTRPSLVNPGVLLDEVLQLYAPRLRNNAINPRLDYVPNATLTCYEGDIRQVLNNLIGNAVDAMRTEGGSLRIRTRPARRASTGTPGVLITVADTGAGMSRQTRNQIFDAFFTTKGIHGTGLGLWISSRIIHKHRGYLRCHSALNRGSVFQLWLPEELAPSARESWHDTDELAPTAAE